MIPGTSDRTQRAEQARAGVARGLSNEAGASEKDISKGMTDFRACVLIEGKPRDCSAEASQLARLLKSGTARSLSFNKAGEFFNIFMVETTLALQRAGCSTRELAGHHVAWSAWSKSKKPQNENEERSGQFGSFHSLDAEMRLTGSECLLVVQLPIPKQDLRRLTIGLLDPSKSNALWQTEVIR